MQMPKKVTLITDGACIGNPGPGGWACILRYGEHNTEVNLDNGTLVYTMVRKEPAMETLKIGIREFRDNLATYLLESEAPLAITRHGDTVGYFIPVRRKRSEAERAALKEASARWQEVLVSSGISEEGAVTDFKRWRAKQKR
jgi:PHD/YefM family antitoxin component YafN of YafNO toxin-antitoxin module